MTNQHKIIENQQKIERNQARLMEILRNQEAILKAVNGIEASLKKEAEKTTAILQNQVGRMEGG